MHYPTPLHLQPVYAELARDMGWTHGSFPVAEHAADRVLSLPMHPYLEPHQIEEVTEALKIALRGPVGASAQRV